MRFFRIMMLVTLVACMATVTSNGLANQKKLDAGVKGLPPVPEGKVAQYVVNCGDLPGKCPGIISMSVIYTDPDELGFQLKNPESIRQYEAAMMAQKTVYEGLKNSGILPQLEQAIMGRVKTVGERTLLARAERESRLRMAEYLALYPELSRAELAGFTSISATGRAAISPEATKPVIKCSFGDPCEGGNCGTILWEGTPGASCIAACIDCERR